MGTKPEGTVTSLRLTQPWHSQGALVAGSTSHIWWPTAGPLCPWFSLRQGESNRNSGVWSTAFRLVLDQEESQRDQARQTRAFKQRAAGDPASIVCPFMELAKSRALGREEMGLMSETGSERSEVKSQYLSAA